MPRSLFSRAHLFLAVIATALAFSLPVLAQTGEPAATATGPANNRDAVAIFAGGCFWCVESDFDHVPGVTKTISGYTGGTVEHPTYEQVSAGGTGHRESVEIHFDPAKVSYKTLLDVFWHSVDPTDGGGQFCDRGFQYTTAIFATTEEQLREARQSKEAIAKVLGKPVKTVIERAKPFWPAEDYHQNYYKKNPLKYRFYRWSCGRDARVEELWGKDAHHGMQKEE